MMTFIDDIIKSCTNVALIPSYTADGIASASIISHLLPESNIVLPKLGFYDIESIPIEKLDKYDVLVFLSFDLKQLDLKELEKLYPDKRIIVINHYTTCGGIEKPSATYICIPQALGVHYPSTTWLLNDIIHSTTIPELPLVIGVLSEVGLGYRSTWVKQELELIALKRGWTPSQLYMLAQMIDSCYKIFDNTCLYEVFKNLKNDNIEDLPLNTLTQNFKLLLAELGKVVEGVELTVMDRYIVVKIESKYIVSFDVAKILNLKYLKPVICINRRGHLGEITFFGFDNFVVHKLYNNLLRYPRRNVMVRPIHRGLHIIVKDVREHLERIISEIRGLA